MGRPRGNRGFNFRSLGSTAKPSRHHSTRVSNTITLKASLSPRADCSTSDYKSRGEQIENILKHNLSFDEITKAIDDGQMVQDILEDIAKYARTNNIYYEDLEFFKEHINRKALPKRRQGSLKRKTAEMSDADIAAFMEERRGKCQHTGITHEES